jgi:molybdopterin synthase sulfur carrier subunit
MAPEIEGQRARVAHCGSRHDTSRMEEQSRPIEVHLFAAARSAAGADVVRASGDSLGEVLSDAVAQAPGLASVIERCSVLVDGVATHDLEVRVPSGSRVDVLPPFAGG